MKWMTPRKPVTSKWTVSSHTKEVLELYSKFIGCPEDDIVDHFLKNLLGDPRFANYLRGQRRNKRIISRVFFGDSAMTLLNEYALSCNSFPGTPTFEETEQEQDDEVKPEDDKPKQEEAADVKKD